MSLYVQDVDFMVLPFFSHLVSQTLHSGPEGIARLTTNPFKTDRHWEGEC